jgi:hypothetical protein
MRSAAAASGLTRFRFIFIVWEQQPPKWAGRAEKIFVVVSAEMLLRNEAEAVLRSFTDYDFYSRVKVGGTIICTQ